MLQLPENINARCYSDPLDHTRQASQRVAD